VLTNQAASSKARLRAYFLAHVGDVLDSQQLRQASGNANGWGGRVRELRAKEGYQILTHRDRSHLKPGQYLLLDPLPKPALTWRASQAIRKQVLKRNDFTCQMCGAVRCEPNPDDGNRRTRLRVDLPNLRTLCWVCYEGARKLSPNRSPLQELLIQVRRASGSDQLAVLRWLLQKFPEAPTMLS